MSGKQKYTPEHIPLIADNIIADGVISRYDVKGNYAKKVKEYGRKQISEILHHAADIVKIANAVMDCEGVKNCLKNGCDSCRFNESGCNSRLVVNAVKEYLKKCESQT